MYFVLLLILTSWYHLVSNPKGDFEVVIKVTKSAKCVRRIKKLWTHVLVYLYGAIFFYTPTLQGHVTLSTSTDSLDWHSTDPSKGL